METFKIIKPSVALQPFVKHYWMLKIDTASAVSERTIPVGCIHLIFHRGSRMFSSLENEWQPRSFIGGHSMTYTDLTSKGIVDMIAVVFQPYAPKAFFTIPMNEFYGRNVAVADAGGQDLIDLESRLLDSSDDSLCIHLIESFLLSRLHTFPEYNLNRMTAAVREINRQPQITASGLSQVVCLSNKQFNRIFAEYVGATPKEFARIVRLQRTLYSLQNSPENNFAQLACDCGFYDQSHLIKEFKAFSGFTPAEYLAVCNPYSDYFSTHG